MGSFGVMIKNRQNFVSENYWTDFDEQKVYYGFKLHVAKKLLRSVSVKNRLKKCDLFGFFAQDAFHTLLPIFPWKILEYSSMTNQSFWFYNFVLLRKTFELWKL